MSVPLHVKSTYCRVLVEFTALYYQEIERGNRELMVELLTLLQWCRSKDGSK